MADDFQPLLPCPECMNLRTPSLMIARRTSEKTGVTHYGLAGCEHARETAIWSFPPYGIAPSRAELSATWNDHVKSLQPSTQ